MNGTSPDILPIPNLTTKNYAVKLPPFRAITGVSKSEVQWKVLTLGVGLTMVERSHYDQGSYQPSKYELLKSSILLIPDIYLVALIVTQKLKFFQQMQLYDNFSHQCIKSLNHCRSLQSHFL